MLARFWKRNSSTFMINSNRKTSSIILWKDDSSLIPARAHCCRFQSVLLRYSTGECAPAGLLAFVWFCWNRVNGRRGMVRRRSEWVSKLSSVNMFCFDSRVCTVIKWCSSEADVNIRLSDWNPECVSTTQSVAGWCNGVASLDKNIANEASELWNVSYFRIKATPRNFHGSFILNNSKLSTDFYATNRLLLLTTRKTEKWMPASTVMGGLCFHKMVYNALVICFKSFYRS